MTGLVPVMWAVWGVLALCLMGLKIYSGRLSRDEDDQLILDDAFDSVKAEQAAIVAKVNRLAPVKKTALALFVVATVWVVGYYAWDILVNELHLIG